jgi:uncharacterized protein (TIGR00725 family)
MTAILADRTVGVLGSGSEDHEALAEEVGALLARLGVNLLTGAGSGVMTSVSRAFTQAPRARGICIGIVPCSPEDPAVPKAGYPNPFVELPIYTHLSKSGEEGTSDLSRNHINVLSSAVFIALPGGAGTVSEVELALRYKKPVIVYSPDESFVRAFPSGAPRAATIQEVEDFLRLQLGEE